MSLLSRLLTRARPGTFADRAGGVTRQAGYAEWLAMLLRGGLPTRAGIALSATQALQVSTVLACVRLISVGLGALPIVLREKNDVGAENLQNTDAANLLDQPNDWMTMQELVEMVTLHAALTGNGYAIVQRGIQNRPIALLPVQSGWVEVKQRADWTLDYWVTWPSGQRDLIPFENMLHLRAPSWDAVVGMDAIKLARETIGLAAAIEWTQAGHFGKGPTPPGYLKSDQSITKEQASEIQDAWAKSLGGENAGKIAVVSRGFDFKTLSLDYATAQTIETRKLQIDEICRVFGVFPQMVGAGGGRTTYASAESFFTAHVMHTLAPWARRWEAALRRDLLNPAQRRRQFFEFQLHAMLRADAKSRAAYNTVAIQMGWMTPNQVRAAEGLNLAPPEAGLDAYLRPVNLAPADLAALLADNPQPPDENPAAN